MFFALYLIYWYNINTAFQKFLNINLTIERGESIDNIAQKMKTNGLINSEVIFKLYLYLNNKTNKIKAGKYQFSDYYSIIKLAEILIAGENKSNTVRVKIIEGWSSRDINTYLLKNNLPARENFLTLTQNKISNWQFYFIKPTFMADAPERANLEGYLFPDTYEIYNNSSAEDLIKKMLYNMDLKLDDNLRAEIAKQKKTIFEILTMASLIEKEVKKPDMNLVSGIFWKRIKNGQRLESCATLAYIIGVNKVQYSFEDTLIDSPFNTYRNNGLPPGPISNPGLDAIRAAVYPTETQFMFFLARPDTGETVFSSTLDEHNKNKLKYLK